MGPTSRVAQLLARAYRFTTPPCTHDLHRNPVRQSTHTSFVWRFTSVYNANLATGVHNRQTAAFSSAQAATPSVCDCQLPSPTSPTTPTCCCAHPFALSGPVLCIRMRRGLAFSIAATNYCSIFVTPNSTPAAASPPSITLNIAPPRLTIQPVTFRFCSSYQIGNLASSSLLGNQLVAFQSLTAFSPMSVALHNRSIAHLILHLRHSP